MDSRNISGEQWHDNPKGRKRLLDEISENGICDRGDPVNLDQVRLARSTLLPLIEHDRRGTYVSSYDLKEAIIERTGDRVTNGAAIKAALEMGLPFEYKAGSPNVLFRIKFIPNEWDRAPTDGRLSLPWPEIF